MSIEALVCEERNHVSNPGGDGKLMERVENWGNVLSRIAVEFWLYWSSYRLLGIMM